VPRERLSVRKITDVLRLKEAGFSARRIAESLTCARSTVGDTLSRASAAGLTWRQFRAQALVALGGLVVLAIILLVSHPHLVHLAAQSATNAPPQPLRPHRELPTGDPGPGRSHRPRPYRRLLGAPLVARELETGTFRLTWTQSVTRTRWLAVKLGLIGLASVIVAGLMSLMVTWWESPIDSTGRFELLLFTERGITLIGYALFAFALGVAAGVLIRRVQPAMVTTLVGFIAARVAVTVWVRPHLTARPTRACSSRHPR